MFQVSYSDKESSYNSSNIQFYPNMRYADREISYSIGQECSEENNMEMKKAFYYLENMSVIRFKEKEKGEITIGCREEERREGGIIIAGEGGPSSIVNSGLFNIILEGQVLLIHPDSCGFNVELHELLHALGFDHSDNPKSIMYNLSNCNQVLSKDIVDEINRLYSVDSLPDLHFSNISAVKKGSYVHMNISVKNRGLKDSESVKVALETDTGENEDFDFMEIEAGAGRTLFIENLKVSLKTESIRLVIKDGSELDLKNNQAELLVSS